LKIIPSAATQQAGLIFCYTTKKRTQKSVPLNDADPAFLARCEGRAVGRPTFWILFLGHARKSISPGKAKKIIATKLRFTGFKKA
jgi:hypothetical protein